MTTPHMDTRADTTKRARFESWITDSPYERDICRWPMDETRFSWPGQYKDMLVQLAWEAWQQALSLAYRGPCQAESYTECPA